VASVHALTAGEAKGLQTVLSFAWKFTVGPVLGWIMAHAALGTTPGRVIRRVERNR